MAISATSSGSTGSQIDVPTIVSQLMTIEKRPLTALQTKEAGAQADITSYARVQGAVGALQSAAVALTDAKAFNPIAATVTGDGLTAAVTDAATVSASRFAVEVQTLASAQALASGALAASTTVVGTGTITLQRGAYNSVGNIFTATATLPPVTITIDSSNNTLAGIRDAINKSNAGVTAAIVTDANGARLTVLANDTGASNSLQITTADGDGNNTDSSGLSQLAFDPTATAGNGKNMTQTQTAANATVVINGLTLSYESNLYSGAIAGVTLNLQKAALGVTNTVALTQDTSGVRSQINTFAAAYNTLLSTMSDLTKYNASTKQAGPLNGDTTARAIQNQISNSLRAVRNSDFGDYKTLSDIGVQFQKDGTLKVNDTALNNALGNPTKLAAFF